MNITDFFVDEKTNVISAMEKLDRVGKKILFVVENGILLATITDGDIRRWILKRGDLHATVDKVANYHSKYLLEENRRSAQKFMKINEIEAVPIVDQQKKILSIIFWNDKEVNNKKLKNVPVVVMAGGLGTRLYPYTKILPKPLIPIGEIPISELIINRFQQYGCEKFYLVVNHKKNMIKAYFNDLDRDYSIEFVEEEVPLGTGGGLRLARKNLDSTFILTNCDIIIDEDIAKIYEFHKEKKNLVTMVCSLKKVRVPYGVIEIDNNGEMMKMTEKPEFSYLTNTGVYVVEPEVIDEIQDNESIGFPDVMIKLRNKGQRIGIYPITENSWMDMGQLDDLYEMRKRIEGND